MHLYPSRLISDPLPRRVWQEMGSPAGCHVAGGWVRDRLLGLDTLDVDIAVETSVEDAGILAGRLAERHGVRAHLLGRRPRAVWRVETPRAAVEVWPLGDLDLEGDARRRDFTCNAMLWTLPDGPLHDVTGGRDDLRQDRLRAVARTNLADDPVRLLRGIRFLAQLPELELDAGTRTWIGDLAPRLRSAPRQRLGHEIVRTVAGPGVASALVAGSELGVWRHTAPHAADDPDRLATHADAASRLAVASRHPVPAAVHAAGDAARLGLVASAWRPASDGDLTPYGWPRRDREAASTVARELEGSMRTVAAPAADRREAIARVGAAMPAMIAVGGAVRPDLPWRRWWRQWRRSGERLAAVRPLLTADEVAERLGLAPGPELGRTLAELVRAQVRGEVRSADGARRWLRSRRQ